MHRYADLDQLIYDVLPEGVTNDAKESLGRVLEEASAYIDTQTGKSQGFYLPAPEQPKIKRFMGEGKRTIIIPIHVEDTLSVQGLTHNEFYTSEDGDILYRDDPNEPAARVDFDYENWRELYGEKWHKGRTYRVSARWGFAETPSDIVRAAKVITMHWWRRQTGTLKQIKTPDGIVIEVSIPKEAKDTILAYRDK